MDEMIHQLSVSEIDQIISFLQEPYPYELIKRLEKLKEETIFYIKMRNQKVMEDLDIEKQLKEQGGWKTSPVSGAYFKMVDADENMQEVVAKAKKYLEEIRNDLVIHDASKNEKYDTNVLMSIMDINHLEQRLDRIQYNDENDFVTRFRANPRKTLSELKQDRTISNMFFDFMLDLGKAQILEIPETVTVKELNDFIDFWIKEHFKRSCDERSAYRGYALKLEEFTERYHPGAGSKHTDGG